MATFQTPNSETMGLPGAYAQVARARQSAMISQVRVPARGARGVRALGLGDVGQNTGDQDTVTVNVRELQRFLIQAGYSVGPTGADGVYGPATSTAFSRFVTSTIAEGGSLSWRVVPNVPTLGRMQLYPKVLWTKLQIAAAQRSQADARAARAAQVAPSIPDQGGGGAVAPAVQTETASGGWGWIGVAIAGAAVVGIGAVLMMK